MTAASRDGNNVPSKLAVLNTDSVQGTNLVKLGVTAGGIMKVDATATISFTMQPVDPRDQNYVGVWLFKGSDGKTYPAVATSAGALLIET